MVRPEDAWIEATETPRRIRERIPRISEAMYGVKGGAALAAALNLTDAGRPKVKDLLVLLESVAAEADAAAGATNREIDLAARWAQRTLDDVLDTEPDPHPTPGNVRLLARHKGKTAFVAQPPFADDPLLRDTWEMQRPVLTAEARLTKLTAFLSLTRLDDVVRTSALPFGEHHDGTYDEVRRKLDAIKPYLFALVRAENPRAESQARSALKRLELVLCDELVLKYEYDGAEVEREDAVCYIASRREAKGRRSLSVGTAYLELDPATKQPHWFPLGRQLAQHLGVPPLADAFTMLLTVPSGDRDRMMTDRQIKQHDINDARRQLSLRIGEDEELSNILDSLLPSVDASESVAAQAEAAYTSAEAPVMDKGTEEVDGESAVSTVPDHNGTIELPTVNQGAVRIVDARLNALAPASAAEGSIPAWRGSDGYSEPPTARTTEENRRVGRRGEGVVFDAERDRVREMGRNPASVNWVSKTDELSPFDLMSVDEDGQLIYIEVKSTKGSDPSEAFYISHAELLEAVFRRSQYYIYRVTDVDTATPRILRKADPLGQIQNGRGRLLLANARMTLNYAGEEEAVPPEELDGSAAE